MVKVHVVVEAYKGCIDAVHVFDDLKAAIDKLEAIKKSPAFSENDDDAQLFLDVEIIKPTTPLFRIVEFRKKAFVNVICTDKTQEEAASITHGLNCDMPPAKRAQGYHYEMEPITVERASGDTERHS